MDKEAKAKWPESIAEMFDALHTKLRAFVPEEQRSNAAFELLLAVLNSGEAGMQFYMPKADALERELRDRVIYTEAKRLSIGALAQRYRLTDSRVYAIIREQESRKFSQNQGTLF